MTKIKQITIGIDPAIYKFGWCLLVDGEVFQTADDFLSFGVDNFKKGKGNSEGQFSNLSHEYDYRIGYFYNLLSSLNKDYDIQECKIGVELTKGGMNVQTSLILSFWTGIITEKLRSMVSVLYKAFPSIKIEWFFPSPNEWRKEWKGSKKDREALKLESIKRASEFVGGEVSNDDEADAINIARWIYTTKITKPKKVKKGTKWTM